MYSILLKFTVNHAPLNIVVTDVHILGDQAAVSAKEAWSSPIRANRLQQPSKFYA